MTSAEHYSAIASQLKSATEQSADLWKQGARALAEQAEAISKLPPPDPTAGVNRYFELLQRAVDVNRDLATKWAEAVDNMSHTLQEQLASVSRAATGQLDAAADLAGSSLPEQSAESTPTDEVTAAQLQAIAETTAKLTAAAATQVGANQASPKKPADRDAKPQAAKDRAAKRVPGKPAAEETRNAYAGLTKAELSSKLAERGLPKSGNLSQLVDRLVEADTRS